MARKPTPKGWQLGKRIAPPRFLIFVALLVAGMGAAVPLLGAGRGIMAAFDVASTVFLLSLAPLFRHGEAAQMRKTSQANDANRTLLLGFTAVVTLVILVAVGAVVKESQDALATTLVVATLVLAWLFSNVIYTLHYAHLYYASDGGGDAGGLSFPECDQPDYWDFFYFSVTLGMAFATSDVQITTGRLRRVATGQTLAAFVFNLGVIAFAVGALGGG